MLSRSSLVQAADHIVDFLLTRLNPADNFSGFDALESEDLVEFTLEFGHKGFFVVFGPWPSFRMRFLCRGLGFVRGLERLLEVVIGNIIIVVVFQQRCPQLLAKAKGGEGLVNRSGWQ